MAPTAPPAAARPAAGDATAARDFVLEVGTEELPPDDVQAGISQLR